MIISFSQAIPVEEFRIDHPPQERNLAIAYPMFCFLLSFAVGFLIRAFPIPFLGAASFTEDVWYLCYKIGFFLCIPLLWFYTVGYRVTDLIPKSRLNPRIILLLLISLFSGFFLNLLNPDRLDAIFGAFDSYSTTEIIFRLSIAVFIPLFAAAIPEELVFRGFVQTRIELEHNRAPAILLSAILFTLWHIPTRYLLASGAEGNAGDLVSVIQGTAIPVFIAGLVFGILWDRYRNLLALMALHWGIDIIPSLESLFGIIR